MVADLNSVTETELVDVASWRRLAESILRDNARRGGSLTNIPTDPRLTRNDSDWVDIPRVIREREYLSGWDAPQELTLWAEYRWNTYLIRVRRGEEIFHQAISREALDSPSLDVLEYMAREMGRVLRIDTHYVSYALHQLLIVEPSGRRSLRCDYRVPIRVQESTREMHVAFNNLATATLNLGDTFLASAEFQRYMNEAIASAVGLSAEMLDDSPEAKQRAKEHEEADARAKQILIDHLDEKQKESFGKHGSFSCVGKTSGDHYFIHSLRNVNVSRLTKEGKNVRYCLVQKGDVPLYDQLLTQKLLIENNEEMFLEKANNMSEQGYVAVGNWSNFRFSYGVDAGRSTIVMPTL